MTTFRIEIGGKRYKYETVYLDQVINRVLGSKLVAELEEGERIDITADGGRYVHRITRRVGREHWNHPGYQFGSILKEVA